MNGSLLYVCGALAAGEYAASLAPQFSGTWPALAAAAALTALFGYGLSARGWRFAAVFLAGAALYFSAATADEKLYFEKPWLRNRRLARAEESTGARWGAARNELARRAAIGLERDAETAALNRAILFGGRSGLPRRMKRVFEESGTMHVFAVSGLHVMAVAQTLVWMTALLAVPRRFAGAAALPAVWGYVFLIGCRPSAVRAALMATTYLLAPVFWRRGNLLRSWGVAFLAVHLARPGMINDTGSAMSFLVMLAIGLVCENVSGAKALWVTAAAWAAGAPVAAHVFGRITPGGILANLLMLAAAGCSVTTGVFGIAASFFSEHLAAHLNNLSALFTKAMLATAQSVAIIPGATISVPNWSLPQCAAWYAALALAAFLYRSVRSRTAI